MKKIILLLLCFFWTMPALASKEEKMREYWKMQGVDLSTLVQQSILNSSFGCFYVITEQGTKELKEEIQEIVKPFENDFVKLYDNFTEEELDELIKWGNSDLGKKERSLLPQVSRLVSSHMKRIAPIVSNRAEQIFQRQPSEEEVDACMKRMGY